MENLNHDMLNEIREEASLIEEIVRNKEEYTKDFVNMFKTKDIKKVYFSGTGSPSNVCLCLRILAEQLLHVDTTYSFPVTFKNYQQFNPNGVYTPDQILLICPAESGRTKAPADNAIRAKELGINVSCSTYNPEGLLARNSDVVLVKKSGKEKALPSTKGHVSGLFLNIISFVEAAYNIGKINEDEYKHYCSIFEELPENILKNVECALQWYEENADKVNNADRYWFVGCGADFATARESALKFMEASKKTVYYYELEEFLHGPVGSVNDKDMVFLLESNNESEQARMKQVAEFLTVQTDKTVYVSTEEKHIDKVTDLICHTHHDMVSTPIELLVPMQTVAMKLADYLGIDVTQYSKHSASKFLELSYKE